MSKQNKDHLSSEYSEVENKLLLLYLVNKMDLPLSNSQISQFALEENIIGYFTLQQILGEMVESGYLEITRDNNVARYTITDEGITALEYFDKQIPTGVKDKINKFILDNRKSIKKDFEITANYFYDHNNNEYTVKCGSYEDEKMLMEINVSVVTKEQAKLICNNWKRNVPKLYGKILSELVNKNIKNN